MLLFSLQRKDRKANLIPYEHTGYSRGTLRFALHAKGEKIAEGTSRLYSVIVREPQTTVAIS